MKIDDNTFLAAWEVSSSVSDFLERTGLKDYRGVQRRRRRLESKYDIHLRPLGGEPSRNWHPLTEHYTLDKDYTAVVFSDAHFWPLDKCKPSPATSILLKVLSQIKPDILIDCGDSFDGATISRHPPHGWQDLPTVEEELEANKYYHTEIKKAAGNPECFWIWGNHDARFDSKLSSQAPQMQGVKGFALPDHFPDWQFSESLTLNELVMLKHSWHQGVHAEYNNVLKSGISMVTGHLHRGRAVEYTDLSGTRFGIGCPTLAYKNGPQFFYTNHNPVNWQEGFLVLELKKGKLHYELVHVRDDMTVFRGETISA